MPIDRSPSDGAVRGFACLWLPLAASFIGWLLWRAWVPPSVLVPYFGVVALIALVGAVRPAWVRPLYVALTIATWPLNAVGSTLVLAVVFFLIVTPIGLLRRALGRDALALRLDREAATYWVERPAGPEDPERVFRQS